MASFAWSKRVYSQQRMQFKTYPLGSIIAQLWQLLTQLPSTNPTPRYQISSMSMDQIWMLEIPTGCLQPGNYDLQQCNVQVSLAVDQRC